MIEDIGAFERALAAAPTQHAAFDALYRFSHAHEPVRLWTIMVIDHEAGLARRAYTNRPEAYPASGTKPMMDNAWSDIVKGQHRPFVANRLQDIAEVFADHELIGELGCGSVLNLPIIDAGQLVGTINLLDVEQFFTAARVARCEALLTEPGGMAMARARGLPEP